MIDSEGDIWEAWRQYLEEHNGYHKYSMEKYHIIKCGYSIRCNPNIPSELYEHIGFSNDDISTEVIPCPFITCKKYSTLVFKSMESNKHWKQVEEIIINSCEEKKGLGSRDVDFVESFFRFCITLFKKPNLYERLKISECNFNRLLIWPAMEVAVDSISCSDLSFMSAEYKLKSSDEEYKADACVLDDDNNEISILETSGKFMLDDNSKYGYDHVKCTFGALTIFNAAFKKYFWSREDTGLQLRIPFLHARHDMLHLWSLELCSSKLYISKKIYKCVVPANMTDVKDILALGNLVWLYREELEKTVKTLKKMKKEHNSYEFERMLGSDDARESLSKMVNSKIQRPIQGAGFGILLSEEKDDEESVVRFIKAED
ncbi:hypothetical protein G6F57_013586 [Rhizopus arrhizus]|uniref:Uncharacterized protein n=1 Tax=Rhizopus oryzae TaxID=64495 RepID=A0A9P6WY78_RHIOR|nr:hypothetical protein G6F27_012454 [Rhizopus arrhizus]KAG1016539.1 hypothetical protein G6F26_012446 [Rhizopus arrhizus]KAG1028175.1 hypothetical protein G6F25_012457 [Rhizopus arrhizus]KAG1301063.1 hypothetical protein G6F64_012134 [Rhizopus arrhizus]KAG1325215.1 hypothetical protein G6F63_012254 [Rhizopus arrhizus]